MDCELNKPLCKRKLLMKEGPFERKKKCPLSEKNKCPLSQPQCPLLPEEENDCPISKLVGNKNTGQKCPLAQQGCPCDPNPPCPLAYDDDYNEPNGEQHKPLKVPCPLEYPIYKQSHKTSQDNEPTLITNPCPNNLLSKDKKSKNDEEKKNNANTKNKSSSSGTGSTSSSSKEESNDSNSSSSSSEMENGNKFRVLKKGLNVPDCTLASSRPLPCSECLGDLLANMEKSKSCKLYNKDCPYLKIINKCDNSCLCENVPRIDTGPPCPFAPKPCPCCAAVRCPLTRIPDCPLVSRDSQKSTKPPTCKCYCPVVPPPCSSNIPPQCKLHNNKNPAPCPLNPPKCDCNKKEEKKCPLVPSLYPSCPLQPCYQTEPCYKQNLNPKPPVEIKKPQLPCLLVPPNVFCSLESTLEELNKLCTCDNPPSPQMVNMVPTNCVPQQTSQIPNCIAEGDHNNCPIECPCEPPRTFHVPTCSKKKPPCLRSFPKSKKKGELVCPFSPRCCPLGPICPFPIEAAGEEKPGKTAPVKFTSSQKSPTPTIRTAAQAMGCKEPQIEKVKHQKENNEYLSKAKSKSEGTTRNNDNNQFIQSRTNSYTTSQCPLNDMPDDKKTPCPFAPDPCPLEPIKPLSIKEPKPCPFAPEPACPLMPKPLCPAKPRCLMKPTAPLPECPYAPPGCPLAPKKLCTTDNATKDYSCPCPQPQPCPCPNPKPKCPCPKPSSDCPCANPEPGCPCSDPDPGCPCPPPQTGCPCPDPDPGCPCSPPQTGCPCPDPNPDCPCSPPQTGCPCPDPNPGCPCSPPQTGCPCPDPNPGCPCSPPQTGCPCPDPNPGCPCPDPDPGCPCSPPQTGCPCPDPNPCCPCPPPQNGCPCSDPEPGCPCAPPQNGCPCPPPQTGCSCADSDPGCPCPEPAITCPLIPKPKPKCPLTPKFDSNCPLSEERMKQDSLNLNSRNTCPLANTKTENTSDSKCPCSSIKASAECPCPSEDGTKCPCPMLFNKPCCQCKKSDVEAAHLTNQAAKDKTVPESDCLVENVISKLKKKSKELDCPIMIPPCEKFPEGRCPMEDLGLCDCDYPCPPCLESAKCGTAKAPPQYCTKLDCCMGLPLPPVTTEEMKEADSNKGINYFKLCPTKPDREETKYYVDILDHPPNEHPFGPPKERQHPNWFVVKYGTAYEKCKTVAEKLKDRKPVAEQASQFNPKDNPMDPETKVIMENRKHQEQLEKQELTALFV